MTKLYVKMIEKATTTVDGTVVTYQVVADKFLQKYGKEKADQLMNQIKTQLIADGYPELVG